MFLEGSRELQRKPPSINLQKDSEHTYVNVPVDSKTEEITEKALIPTTAKADLNVSEKSDSPITANLKENENITDSTQNLIDDKSTVRFRTYSEMQSF